MIAPADGQGEEAGASDKDALSIKVGAANGASFFAAASLPTELRLAPRSKFLAALNLDFDLAT
jgi:hypothetical protein